MQQADLAGLSFMTTKAGLTGISGGATTYSTGSAAQFGAIGGKAITKTQVSSGATPVTDGVTAAAIALVANQGTVVLWCLDASGAVKVVKGSTEVLDASGKFTQAPQFPTLPDTLVPFAYTLHKADSTTSGTWTFGSSNWNATGMTHVVVDLMTLPARSQAS